MESIVELFERLEDMIDEASKVPFTDNVMINKTDLMDILMEMKLKFPNALKQAEWVVQERNKILTDANKEAQSKVKESEIYANKLIDENEITRKAYEEANKIMESARQTEREMKLGAIEYADNVLVNLENSLKVAMESFHHSFMGIEETYSTSLQGVTRSRQELRGINRQNVDNI